MAFDLREVIGNMVLNSPTFHKLLLPDNEILVTYSTQPPESRDHDYTITKEADHKPELSIREDFPDDEHHLGTLQAMVSTATNKAITGNEHLPPFSYGSLDAALNKALMTEQNALNIKIALELEQNGDPSMVEFLKTQPCNSYSHFFENTNEMDRANMAEGQGLDSIKAILKEVDNPGRMHPGNREIANVCEAKPDF